VATLLTHGIGLNVEIDHIGKRILGEHVFHGFSGGIADCLRMFQVVF